MCLPPNALPARPLRAPLLGFREDTQPGVPETFPLNRPCSQGQLLLGTPGVHDPTEESRRGPRVAHALSDREIDWPERGAPEVPTSVPLARWRSRWHGAEKRWRLRFLRRDEPAHRRLATARPRDNAGCGCVTTRAPRVWRLVLGRTRRPWHGPGRVGGVCR